MATRADITDALKWFGKQGIGPQQVLSGCAAVKDKFGGDQGEAIVAFYRYCRDRMDNESRLTQGA